MYGIQLFCVLSNSHPVLWVKRRRLEKDICASDSAAGGSLRPIKHPPAADPGPQALQSLLGATATPPSSDGAVNESLGKPNLSRESRSCRHLHHIKKNMVLSYTCPKPYYDACPKNMILQWWHLQKHEVLWCMHIKT